MQSLPRNRALDLEAMADVGDIAHDLNNFLTTILGHSNLSAIDDGIPTRLLLPLQRIEQAARQAAELTGRLLVLSGRGISSVDPISMNKLTGAVVDALEPAIPSGIEVYREFATDLPLISGDSVQLEQVVSNLLVNAIEAVTAGSGRVCLRTGVVQADHRYLEQTGFIGDLAEGAYVYLQCEDTGCGMDEATARRIFEPFFSSKSAARGMGLAKVLGFVRAHRGGLKVASEPGLGSRFTVLLPVAKRTEPTPTGPLHILDELAPPPAGRSILVVDDDECVREVVAESLQRFGFETLVAVNGRHAIEIVREKRDSIGAVVLDLTMPAIDGSAALRAMTQLKPDLRVVVMSGFTEHEATARLRGFPVAAFLHKPFAVGRLIQCVRTVVGLPVTTATEGSTDAAAAGAASQA